MSSKSAADFEDFPPSFQPGKMRYNRLGRTGLKVSAFSYGGWLTVGGTVKGNSARDLIKLAWENGINTFDTAEVYSKAQCEVEMGQAFKDLKLNRQELVVITKIFFGTGRADPNQKGLSRKHIIEGLKASLRRLQLDYVDVVLAHRDDESIPMEEIVRAFSYLIDNGLVYYWGGSMWSAARLQEACEVAARLGLHAPVADQPHHSMLFRDKVDGELLPVLEQRGIGTTIWSPLEGGVLTGKYNDGVPSDSRYANKEQFKETLEKLQSEEGKAQIEKVKKLTDLAGKLECSVAALALAWTQKNKHVSTTILGATKCVAKPEQLIENLKALDVIDKLTPEYMEAIEQILDNDPQKKQKA